MANPRKLFKYIEPPFNLIKGPRAGRYPFYSAVDQAIQDIVGKQAKGTGDQYLAMLEKTKGVKRAEIAERNIAQALKGRGKMTGKELQQVARENPPVPVYDNVLGGKYNETPAFYDDDEYQQYRTPGGENYREILLKIPRKEALEKPQELTPDALRRAGFTVEFQYNPMYGQASYVFRNPAGKVMHQRSGWTTSPSLTEDDVFADVAKQMATSEKRDMDHRLQFNAPHFGKASSEVLAHARVQDMKGPNGEKIFLIDEVQSDWHQKARDARKAEIKSLVQSGMSREEAEATVPRDYGYTRDVHGGVPDAPFKQNWHELVIKRLMDEAVRGGYDKVLLAPGAEHARRYEMTNFIDNLTVAPDSGGTRQIYFTPKGHTNPTSVEFDPSGVITHSDIRDLNGRTIAETFGKDLGERIMSAQPYQTFEGLDLNVGGEGMKGFYDQILPTYIRKQYGLEAKPYTLPVREYDIVRNNADDGFAIVNRGGFNTVLDGFDTFEQAKMSADQLRNMQYHSFDITPQMKESIMKSGQPLYQAAPVGVGVGIMSQESDNAPDPNEMKRGGRVKVNVSRDAMHLAVLERNQKGKRHG